MSSKSFLEVIEPEEKNNMVELLEEDLISLNLGSKDDDHKRLVKKKARAKKVGKYFFVACFENPKFQSSGQVEPACVCADVGVEHARPDKWGQGWQERTFTFSTDCLANRVESAFTQHLA